ncbi:hypothetical protein RFI_30660 [Reticulomyxa filosa]|uniref:Uncharacterized protein n=1 Tax=Reticulomyxa filosa TaxID=46433 RepID=X6M000_RETFI|nr:hypothetical protein RFI_30660 [Reticulomyxa filosa]|eukprot:ETO06732.1 hypothetical protein RFI_30660 [Reticulomyxa filosa]
MYTHMYVYAYVYTHHTHTHTHTHKKEVLSFGNVHTEDVGQLELEVMDKTDKSITVRWHWKNMEMKAKEKKMEESIKKKKVNWSHLRLKRAEVDADADAEEEEEEEEEAAAAEVEEKKESIETTEWVSIPSIFSQVMATIDSLRDNSLYVIRVKHSVRSSRSCSSLYSNTIQCRTGSKSFSVVTKHTVLRHNTLHKELSIFVL